MKALYIWHLAHVLVGEPVTTSPEHAPSDEGHAARRDQPDGPARRVTLDVHGDRVHGDVRRRDLDMHAERGGAAAEPLRADAEFVHGLAQLRLDPGAFRIGAGGAERPRRRDLGEMHAEVRGAADADADDGRRADAAAALDDAIDDEALD